MRDDGAASPPHTYHVPTIEERTVSGLLAALALARSMVLSGEQMSERAQTLIDLAIEKGKSYLNRESGKGG